jgi:hypothetical protein
MNLAVGLGLRWIPVLIAVTMLGGGVVNIAAPTAIRNSYREWGFPARFYYVTGVLELLAAGLIFFVPAGIFGMLLAAVVAQSKEGRRTPVQMFRRSLLTSEHNLLVGIFHDKQAK